MLYALCETRIIHDDNGNNAVRVYDWDVPFFSMILATPSEPSFLLLCYTLYELLVLPFVLLFSSPFSMFYCGGQRASEATRQTSFFFHAQKSTCMLPFYYHLPPSERDKSHPKDGLLQQQTKQIQKKQPTIKWKAAAIHHALLVWKGRHSLAGEKKRLAKVRCVSIYTGPRPDPSTKCCLVEEEQQPTTNKNLGAEQARAQTTGRRRTTTMIYTTVDQPQQRSNPHNT